jgi:hypothetical protein
MAGGLTITSNTVDAGSRCLACCTPK